MKKLMLSIAAVTAMASAALPAAAQPWRGDDSYRGDAYRGDDDRYERYDDRRYNDGDRYNEDNRFGRPGYSDWLQRSIDRARARGQISGRDAWRLSSQVRAIDDLEARYREDGRLSPREAIDLNQRKDRVAAQLNAMRDRDGGRRDERRW